MSPDADLAAIAAARPDATVVAGDSFTLVKVPLPPAYRAFARDIALYRETSTSPIRQIETASLNVPFIVAFEERFDIAFGRAAGDEDGIGSFTSGLSLRPVHIRSLGTTACVEITLTPLGARRFLGLPMRDLTERLVPLADLGDPEIAMLRERLGNARGWGARLAIAEAFFLARMGPALQTPSATDLAYRAILASRGALPVERIAARLGWSRKHLAVRFRDEIGLPPKQVARVTRFMAAQQMARAGDVGWAEIAAACGYSDQAHLAREFREFAGVTPTQWQVAA